MGRRRFNPAGPAKPRDGAGRQVTTSKLHRAADARSEQIYGTERV